MFPGQGAQYVGMGRALYAAEPVFRDAFDACARAAADELGADLRALVFGEDAEALVPTAVMQPAIFALEYSLARWWMAQGLRPTAMLGHSVGEFVAATLAGVFALEDAVRLVALRGRLMQAQPPGGMLSVRMEAARLLPLLPQGLCLAAENAPAACVVAGPQPLVEALQARLTEEGVGCRPLRTSHAFHSAMMDPVVAPFRAALESVDRRAPSLPIVSSATGQWLDAQTAMSADYWARHLREPVRFASALSTLSEQAQALLLEIGPRGTLCALTRQHAALRASGASAVASLSDAVEHERAVLLAAFAQLWSAGVQLDPATLDRRIQRRRVRLPTYSFQRRRYWVEAPPASQAAPRTGSMEAPVPAEIIKESSMSSASPVVSSTSRLAALSAQLRELFEDVAGFEIDTDQGQAHFMELGLDSLMLTQVALQLQKTFAVQIGFRQLMGELSSIDRLAALLDAQLPAPAPAAQAAAPVLGQATAAVASAAPAVAPSAAMPAAPLTAGDDLRALIQQQMQLMSQQLHLLSGTQAASPQPAMVQMPAAQAVPAVVMPAEQATVEEDAGPARYDVKKAFGAIARIDSTGGIALDARQRAALDAFMARYQARTPASKRYTGEHRPHMADPRVVTGFRPLTKEIVYQIVIERSRGARVWDIDGNEYVDALNGFGASLFGWQPSFVTQAVLKQMELGYEIGPQHPLAGEVSRKVCQLTGHDRAALCNTGSEAVLGALRVARTVTGRSKVALFTGSYHGINDEVIVRGTPKGKAVPAAPGILRNTSEQVLVLEYGTEESLQKLREHAHELAAVLVEPVQSRRPDFQPVAFLRALRTLTESSGTVLIFDEVITGFRSHPGGAQALFGVKADLATYGKVVGGGYPIGVIAGKRAYMDALDGGAWHYGDDSVPEVGVTYFAGTFVRHPLTLAAANASLDHMIAGGPQLQAGINALTTTMAEELNAFARDVGAPLQVRHFASLWRTHFEEEHPLQDLLFAMMRSRGIHILDNFPCFFTSAHTEADMRAIADAWKASVLELQDAGLLPRRGAVHAPVPGLEMDAAQPPVPGARLGRDPDGRPGWYVPNAAEPGRYLKVGG
jgi:acyl transferase domain-containing protein